MARKTTKKTEVSVEDAIIVDETSNSNSVQTSKEVIPAGDFDYGRQLAVLSEKDKQRLGQLTQKLTPKDMTSVRVYGSELSSVIATNGNELLNSVRADKTNEVVELSTDLLGQLNLLDLDKLDDNAWRRLCRRVPMLRRFAVKVENLFAEYDTIRNNVDKISKKIGASKMTALADNSSLQKIFENNVSYINQMRELILAAKLKQQDFEVEMERLKADPNAETWEIKDMADYQNALEKRITDMETEAYILTQNLYQIRAIQSNNLAIADKADNIVTNIIPVWSSQLALAVTMQNQQASIEAQRKIADATNIMLRKNAENLKINSINVAKEAERQLVDLETLQETTRNLVDTIREVQQIHENGSQERKNFEKAMSEYAKQIDDLMMEH